MRLAELGLLAFGPFSGQRLALDAERPQMHLIYGPNEAGKSTALRAISQLLYGIPQNSADDYLHGKKQLRVSGTVLGKSGRSTTFVRRKGRKNTLLTADDEPLDEQLLESLLGGVGEGLFRRMFGLDHETLRAGGDALLRGRGEVGGSLFGAGIGGPQVHVLLKSLQEEADSLFTAKGRSRPINLAAQEVVNARRQVQLLSTAASAYEQQKQELESWQAEHRDLLSRRQALSTERERLQRMRSVMPLLAKLGQARDARAALGHVMHLPPDCGERRQQALRERDQARREVLRLSGELEQLKQQRADITVNQGLVGLDPGLVQDLRDRLGVHRGATRDIPKRRAQIKALRDELGAGLRQLGYDVALEDIERLRVGGPVVARVRRLAAEGTRLDAESANARDNLAECAAAVTRVERELALVPVVPDTALLERQIARARREGDLDARCHQGSEALVQVREQLAVLTQRLKLSVAPERLRERTIPSEQTLEHFAELQAEHARKFDTHAQKRAELKQRRLEIERQIHELEAAGDVPREQDLVALRERRDRNWAELRERVQTSGSSKAARVRTLPRETLDDLEGLMHETDQLADRLRREAQRVSRLGALTAEVRQLAELEAEQGLEQQRLASEQQDATRQWCERWRDLGIEPLTAREMRPVRDDLVELSRLGERQTELDREHAALTRRLAQRKRDLTRELSRLGAAPDDGSADLELVLERAEALVRSAAASASQRRELERELANSVAQRERWQGELSRQESRLQAHRQEWAHAMAELGRGPATTPEEAEALIDGLAELFKRLSEMHALEGRVGGMERDSADLDADVQALAHDYLAELQGEPCEAAAQRLIAAYEQGVAARDRRAQLDHDVASRERALKGAETDLNEANQALADLMEQANVETLEALEQVERKATEARAIEARLDELTNELMDLGGGIALVELERETSGLSSDELSARLAEVAEELGCLDERIDTLSRQIGAAEGGFENLSQGAGQAAEVLQSNVAHLKKQVRRYLHARTAALLLEQEIERYRQENQGPVLSRANDLFVELTLGNYRRLRVGYDARDAQVLCCVRPDDSEVGVEGLSDGTRDQLYLSLRLASLESFAEHNEPLPVVLDDILIHFDDERARAALRVLGQFAQHYQVLFFTHHARLVELAREVVPREHLEYLELPRTGYEPGRPSREQEPSLFGQLP